MSFYLPGECDTQTKALSSLGLLLSMLKLTYPEPFFYSTRCPIYCVFCLFLSLTMCYFFYPIERHLAPILGLFRPGEGFVQPELLLLLPCKGKLVQLKFLLSNPGLPHLGRVSIILPLSRLEAASSGTLVCSDAALEV